jgi:hypothetical protein
MRPLVPKKKIKQSQIATDLHDAVKTLQQAGYDAKLLESPKNLGVAPAIFVKCAVRQADGSVVEEWLPLAPGGALISLSVEDVPKKLSTLAKKREAAEPKRIELIQRFCESSPRGRDFLWCARELCLSEARQKQLSKARPTIIDGHRCLATPDEPFWAEGVEANTETEKAIRNYCALPGERAFATGYLLGKVIQEFDEMVALEAPSSWGGSVGKDKLKGPMELFVWELYKRDVSLEAEAIQKFFGGVEDAVAKNDSERTEKDNLLLGIFQEANKTTKKPFAWTNRKLIEIDETGKEPVIRFKLEGEKKWRTCTDHNLRTRVIPAVQKANSHK